MIVWDADRNNEFTERLEQLGVEDKLTELLQIEAIDVDETQGFISDSCSSLKQHFYKENNSAPESKAFPQVV